MQTAGAASRPAMGPAYSSERCLASGRRERGRGTTKRGRTGKKREKKNERESDGQKREKRCGIQREREKREKRRAGGACSRQSRRGLRRSERTSLYNRQGRSGEESITAKGVQGPALSFSPSPFLLIAGGVRSRRAAISPALRTRERRGVGQSRTKGGKGDGERRERRLLLPRERNQDSRMKRRRTWQCPTGLEERGRERNRVKTEGGKGEGRKEKGEECSSGVEFFLSVCASRSV